MAFDNSSGQKSGGSTPFEWLSGGLFFGKGSKGGNESIDSCKDVHSLLQGIADNLKETLAQPPAADTTMTAVLSEGSSAEFKVDDGATNTPSSALAARLSRLRFLLYDERRVTAAQYQAQHQQDHHSGGWGSGSKSSAPSTVAASTLSELTSDRLKDLMPDLLGHLVQLPFESRKHVAAIFNYLLVCGLEGADAELYHPIMEPFRDYVERNLQSLLTLIVQGHDISRHGASDVVLHFGSMYRCCLRHPSIYRRMLESLQTAEQFVFPFLDSYVHLPNFDISSDAMESVRMIFTAGGERITDEISQRLMSETAAEFLLREYEAVWDQRFNPKLLSDTANYMTRRISLQILSTVLLTRSNYAIMIRYVASRENLMLVMHLLRDTSPHITLDAFHVFKVFVANPKKPPEVVRILKDNQVKLCRYLSTLHQEKELNDAQFRDEKALIIATIEAL